MTQLRVSSDIDCLFDSGFAPAALSLRLNNAVMNRSDREKKNILYFIFAGNVHKHWQKHPNEAADLHQLKQKKNGPAP